MKALSQLVLRAASNSEELQPVQQEAGEYSFDSVASRVRRPHFDDGPPLFS
jgi:hypothetical protein